MVMCTPRLAYERGFPSWCLCPGEIARVLALCVTFTHAGRYNLLLTQVLRGAGPSMWHPCSAIPHAVTGGGDPIKPRRRSGWWWDDFWQCHVGVGLLLWYHFSVPTCLPHHKMSCFFILLVKLTPFLKSPFAIIWLSFNLSNGNFMQSLSLIISSFGVSGLGKYHLRMRYSIHTCC